MLFLVFVALMACLGGTIAAERYDRQSLSQQRLDDIGTNLTVRASRLQGVVDDIGGRAEALAHDIAASRAFAKDANRLRVAAEGQPHIRSVVVSQQLQVVAVYPEHGNETLLAMDFGRYPEFMEGIKRAIATRKTISDAPVQLLQSNRAGLIIRTPILTTSPDGDAPKFWGMVSMATDLEDLLTATELLDPQHQFTLSIRELDNDKVGRVIFGSDTIFELAHAGARITLPDGVWELAAAPKGEIPSSRSRAWVIRLIGFGLGLVLLAAILYRHCVPGRRPRGWDQTPDPDATRTQIPLRNLLLIAMLLPIPPLVGISGWLSFTASIQAAEQLARKQVDELALQIRDHAEAFFDVPRRVVAYNAAQFRLDQLEIGNPEKMQSNFLLQVRQQPLLTFLSVGTIDGEYYAASRPPLGSDKTLRILRATRESKRQMRLFRVNDANNPTSMFVVGNQHFDSRERPWYQTAMAAESLRWYPAYRYAIDDALGAYRAMGMGMASPLYDARQRFVGVLTADVALSQLSGFLAGQVAGLDGTAFITEADGKLLASSSAEPIYHLEDSKTLRIAADESDNPLIRSAGRLIGKRESKQGTEFIDVEETRHLVRWQTLSLPDGPALTIVLAVPDSRFSAPAAVAFRNIAYLTVGFSILGIVGALFAAEWFARPLDATSQWAKELRRGNWKAAPPPESFISELASLTSSLEGMAEGLRQNTVELEARVADRTQALEAANRQLEALSSTDAVTGIANRRHFDHCATGEWSWAIRHRRPLALMMLDVDWFKQYNDAYGHQVGDEALRAVAQVIHQHARRAGDLAARYGGEEFVIIAADADMDAAAALGERVRAAVAAREIPHAGSPETVITVSIGIAVWRPDQDGSLKQLLAKADAALYRAKKAGRNRVELAD